VIKTETFTAFKGSRLVQGMMRLKDWNWNAQQLLDYLLQLQAMGVDTFDHADIYGNYQCEQAFGAALKLQPQVRSQMKLISKCGIVLPTAPQSLHQSKFYDVSKNHILTSVENSLKHLNTDYLDLLLVHRPSPFVDFQEVNEAFMLLFDSGKVLHFGLSNFSPQRFQIWQQQIEVPLEVNQVEVSVFQLQEFESGNFDFYQSQHILPMAWSPMGGGKLIENNDIYTRLLPLLQELKEEYRVSDVEVILWSWLFNHPSKMSAITGTHSITKVKSAIEGMQINLSLEDWYRVYTLARGQRLP